MCEVLPVPNTGGFYESVIFPVESDVPYRSELCGVRVELDKLDNAEAHREARVSAGPVEREVG